MLTKLLVDKFKKRSSRSGIIITSSVISGMPAPYSVCYSATKAFDAYLGMATAMELRKSGVKIDMMVLKPGVVYTKLSREISGSMPTAVAT